MTELWRAGGDVPMSTRPEDYSRGHRGRLLLLP
jgi:hypothetical protein